MALVETSQQLHDILDKLQHPESFSVGLFELYDRLTEEQAEIAPSNYAQWALARYAIEQVIQNHIEDRRVDLRPFISNTSGEIIKLITALSAHGGDFLEPLTNVLATVREMIQEKQIPAFPAVVKVRTRTGNEGQINGWIALDKNVPLPISSKTFPFVPLLEDSILDREISPFLTDAFVSEISDIAAEEKVTCLGFIEKTMGPIGALLLAPELGHRTGLPTFVFRERNVAPRTQVAGLFSPTPEDRVLWVYDLIVSGGGIRHAAELLYRNFRTPTHGAVVFLSYHKDADLSLRYTKFEKANNSISHGTIRTRSIARYVDLEPVVDQMRTQYVTGGGGAMSSAMRGADTPSPDKEGDSMSTPPGHYTLRTLPALSAGAKRMLAELDEEIARAEGKSAAPGEASRRRPIGIHLTKGNRIGLRVKPKAR